MGSDGRLLVSPQPFSIAYITANYSYETRYFKLNPLFNR